MHGSDTAGAGGPEATALRLVWNGRAGRALAPSMACSRLDRPLLRRNPPNHADQRIVQPFNRPGHQAELDLTGDVMSSLDAAIFYSLAVPLVVAKDLDPEYRTLDGVTAPVVCESSGIESVRVQRRVRPPPPCESGRGVRPSRSPGDKLRSCNRDRPGCGRVQQAVEMRRSDT